MKKPRCGVPDDSGDDKRKRRYATTGRWSKNHLTYYVQPGQDLPQVSENYVMKYVWVLKLSEVCIRKVRAKFIFGYLGQTLYETVFTKR